MLAALFYRIGVRAPFRRKVFQISTISKSSFLAPHSGQVQFIGTSSQRVPATMPSSGSPAASSYTKPQMRHIQVLNGTCFSVIESQSRILNGIYILNSRTGVG